MLMIKKFKHFFFYLSYKTINIAIVIFGFITIIDLWSFWTFSFVNNCLAEEKKIPSMSYSAFKEFAQCVYKNHDYHDFEKDLFLHREIRDKCFSTIENFNKNSSSTIEPNEQIILTPSMSEFTFDKFFECFDTLKNKIICTDTECKRLYPPRAAFNEAIRRLQNNEALLDSTDQLFRDNFWNPTQVHVQLNEMAISQITFNFMRGEYSELVSQHMLKHLLENPITAEEAKNPTKGRVAQILQNRVSNKDLAVFQDNFSQHICIKDAVELTKYVNIKQNFGFTEACVIYFNIVILFTFIALLYGVCIYFMFFYKKQKNKIVKLTIMTTVNQLLYKKTIRCKKWHWNRTVALRHCPQKKGVVHRIYTESPKKPNSAKRKVARVRLIGTQRQLRVKIPGPGHGNLARFSIVLIRGSHPRDLPGVRYSIIRGKFGSNPIFGRRKAHSKHGLKKRQLDNPNLV